MPSDVQPSEREVLAWLAILDNIRLAQEFVKGLTAEVFAEDRRTYYAVTRCLEIISEAARRLRGPQQARFPGLEWRQIEDVGNVFRHTYDRVSEDRVYAMVRDRLPQLAQAAETALAERSAA